MPLGLLMLHAAATSKHDVTILDLNFRKDRELLDRVKADLVGISCMTLQRDYVLSLARTMKRKGIAVVVGGPHPTLAPEEVLRNVNVDYVVSGDADKSFPDLLAALERDGPLSEIAGLGYKNPLMQFNPVSQIDNLDALPFPSYDAIDVRRYPLTSDEWNLEIPYEASRGCPFSCIFCSSNLIKGKRYRVVSLERLNQDLNRIAEQFPNDRIFVRFQDNDFALIRKRVLDFCDMMSRRPDSSRLFYGCLARANQLDKFLVKRLKDTGCRRMFIGGEAGYQQGLDSINKGIKVRDIRNATRMCRKLGIKTEVSFIVGFPWEKRRDTHKTLQLAISLEQLGASTGIYVLVPFPGTPVRQWLLRQGIHIDDSSSADMDVHHERLTFDHPFLTNSDLREVLDIHERAHDFMNNDPEQMARLMDDAPLPLQRGHAPTPVQAASGVGPA